MRRWLAVVLLAAWVLGGSPAQGALEKSGPVSVNTVASMAQPVDEYAAAWGAGALYVFGGGEGSYDQVQRWLPGEASSTVVAHMPAARAYAAAVWTGSRFLIFGGTPGPRDVLAFDPVTNMVALAGSLPVDAYGVDAAWADGVAYIVTGNQVLRYQPATSASSVVATLPAALSFPGVGWISPYLYVAGGSTTDILRIDPTTGAVLAFANVLPHPWQEGGAFADGSNFYLVGGYDGTGAGLASFPPDPDDIMTSPGGYQKDILRIDPVTGSVTDAGSLPVPNADIRAVFDGECAAYVASGDSSQSPRTPPDIVRLGSTCRTPGSVTIAADPPSFGTCAATRLAATFHDTPLTPPVTYAWTMPGGDPATSDQPAPAVRFATPGTYAVGLTATGSDGTVEVAEAITVTTANCPPVAAFSVSPGAQRAGLPFTFRDESTDSDSPPGCTAPGSPILQWHWTVDEGVSPTLAEPNFVKIFDRVGIHQARLMVTDCDDDTSLVEAVRAFEVLPNQPPVLAGLGHYFAVAGDSLHLGIGATDKDGGAVTHPYLELQQCGASSLQLGHSVVDDPVGDRAQTVAFADWNTTGVESGVYLLCVHADDGELNVEGIVEVTVVRRALDSDYDGLADAQDNCPAVPNMQQLDSDFDGAGDACDYDLIVSRVQSHVRSSPALTSIDADQDGIADLQDNCPAIANSLQTDLDQDGIGNACDLDVDGDGVGNASDDCVNVPDPAQRDRDRDGRGDACQILQSSLAKTAEAVTSRSNPQLQSAASNPIGLAIVGFLPIASLVWVLLWARRQRA